MENELHFYVQALFDFETDKSNELKFKAGDVLKVSKRINHDWFNGNVVCSVEDSIYSNSHGIFPSNFVQKLTVPSDLAINDVLFLVRFNFEKTETGDLELSKGEIVIGKRLIDQDWWFGCQLNDSLKSGIFPLTHVNRIDIDTVEIMKQNVANQTSNLIYENNEDTYSEAYQSSVTTCSILAKAIENFSFSNLEKESFQYLNLVIDDIVLVTKKIDSYWLEGENFKGGKGLFPVHCVEFQNEESKPILNRTQRHLYMNLNSIDDDASSLDLLGIKSETDLQTNGNEYENLQNEPTEENKNVIESARDDQVYEIIDEIFNEQTSVEVNHDFDTLTSNNESESLKTLTDSSVEQIQVQLEDEIYSTINDIKESNKIETERLRPPLPPKPQFLRLSYSNPVQSDKVPASSFSEKLVERIEELSNIIKLEKMKKTEENNNDTDNQKENKDKIERLTNEFTKLTDMFLKMEPNHEFVKKIVEYKQNLNNNIEHNTEKSKFEKDNQRKNIITELIETENDYFEQMSALYNCFHDQSIQSKKPEAFSSSLLFSNLHEILQISSQFIDLLDLERNKDENEIRIGSCLIRCANEMQQFYAIYCRDYATVNELIKKYLNNKEINEFICSRLKEIQNVAKNLSLSALLIKPVQRITKYSLFIDQLIKKTPPSHCDYSDLKEAGSMFNNILIFINEYKRRKDLILKYRNKEDNRNVFEKITMNTLRKKSNRLGMRISTVLGLFDQTVDIRFNYEEERFRTIEKETKIFINESNNILTHFKEMLDCQIQITDDFIELYNQDEPQKDLLCVLKKCYSNFVNNNFDKFIKETYERIWKPLTDVISSFEMPNKLIEKRFNKLLDYDKARGDIEKAKLNEKTKEMNAIMDDAKRVYQALNDQLLDELPILTNKTTLLLGICMKTFVILFKSILKTLQSELFDLEKKLQLPEVSVSLNETIKVYLNSLKFQNNNERSNENLLIILNNVKQQTEEQKSILKQKYDADCIYKAMRDHESLDESLQLSANVGDIFGVIKRSDPLGKSNIWYCDDGESKGFLPSSILVPLNKADETKKETTRLPKEPEHRPSIAPSINFESIQSQEICTALYNFDAFKNNMLSMKKGDTLVVVDKRDKKGDSQWWLVETFDGNRGYVPYNYVSLLD